MNPEILQMKGMLAEAKKKYRSLDTEASALVILIRSLLNPYEEIQKLDMDKVLVSVKRQKNSVGYENKTLKQIAKEIADKHGYTLVGEIADVRVDRITQNQERDLSFLTKLVFCISSKCNNMRNAFNSFLFKYMLS